MNILQIVLTSSLISGIISAIISYFFNIRMKKLEYKNEYYKILIKKRIDAYQFVENQISVLRNIAHDEDDGKLFHLMFAYGEEKCVEFQNNIMIANAKGIWLDEETSKTLDNFNSIFYLINNNIAGKNEEDIMEIGKKYYEQLSKLRVQLENNLRIGLNNLHNVDTIFKTKEYKIKQIVVKQ